MHICSGLVHNAGRAADEGAHTGRNAQLRQPVEDRNVVAVWCQPDGRALGHTSRPPLALKLRRPIAGAPIGDAPLGDAPMADAPMADAPKADDWSLPAKK